VKQWFWEAFAVGSAGFLGSIARWMMGSWFNHAFMPWGTLLVNITGSLFLGWFYTVISQRVQISNSVKLAVAVGFVGAFTTFSSLMWEADDKFRGGSHWLGWLYLGGSILLGLMAVRAGVMLGQGR